MDVQSNSIELGGNNMRFRMGSYASFCLRQTPVQHLEVAEAFALRKFKQICDKLDLNHATFERNCLLMVKVTNSEDEIKS